MTRPLLEVADIVRAQGDRFIHSNFRWFHWAHRKVLRAIARCRTAALGGHRDQCRAVAIAPPPITVAVIVIAQSVRAALATSGLWLGRVNFCPSPMSTLALVCRTTFPHWRCRAVLYDLLSRASAETLQEVARDLAHPGSRHPGFLSVLHTWGQRTSSNVAVTRARQKLTAVSSFSHLDVDQPGSGPAAESNSCATIFSMRLATGGNLVTPTSVECP